MPIIRIANDARTFLEEGGPVDPEVYVDSSLDFEGLSARWSSPAGVYPIGEGWRSGDYVYQPCLVEGATEYGDQTDNKLLLKIARLELPDLDSLEWIDASPAETTMPGFGSVDRYNTARRLGGGDGYCTPAISPWGKPGDSVGDGYFGHVVDGDIFVPKLKGDLQVYAIDVATGEKLWERLGFSEMPEIYANGEWVDEGPYDATDLETLWPNWELEHYTVLGPGRPGHILVHIQTTEVKAKVSPDWRRRLSWDVTSASGLTTANFNFSLPAKWQEERYDPSGYTVPSAQESIGDLPESTPSGHPELGPNKGREYSPQSRPGRYETSTDIENALAACLDDCLELAGKLAWEGLLRPTVSTRIEEIDIATGETVSTLDGPSPTRTGKKNISGVGTATRTDYTTTDILDFPAHPNPPEPGEVDPDRAWKYPPPEEGMAEDYAGGVYGAGTALGPVLMLAKAGPYDFTGYWLNENVFPSTMDGWANWYSLKSADSSELSFVGSPPGILIASDPYGDFSSAIPSNFPDGATVYRCYSPYISGDQKFTRVSPPWPWNPMSLATDGEVAIFAPHANSVYVLGDEDQNVGLDSDWPAFSEEVDRCHRIACYELADESPTLLWELDARAIAGAGSVLENENPHPGDGDCISNGVIQGGYYYCMLRGSNGQTLLRVRIRDLLSDQEDPESEVLEAAGSYTARILTADTGLVNGSGGIYEDPTKLLCWLPDNEDYDTLMINGDRICGVRTGKQQWVLR